MNTTMTETGTAGHAVVSNERWLAERRALLAREKELMRLHDELARERRALPWERVDKPYVFDTPQGPRTLAELFGGRRQLLVQHFMLGPDWAEGCPSCSYMADHVDGMNVHLAQRDIQFVAVSRAPLAQIERFRARMGWRFDWVSSHGSDFNFDFGVSFTPEQLAAGPVGYNYRMQSFPGQEAPGVSVFYRKDANGAACEVGAAGAGDVFHTYSTYGRGVEVMMGAYALMDLVPEGRGEREVPHKMEWVRHHDRYAPAEGDAKAAADSCCSHR